MRELYVVSDATGSTAERVLEAAIAQFTGTEVNVLRFGLVRTTDRIEEIVRRAASTGGFIVHTLVSRNLRRHMLVTGRNLNVATIDLMGPLLARLADILKAQPKSEPGLFTPFDSSYLDRIDAMEYTVRHDDGRNPGELDHAEIVLTGVSRTSKTPLSIYLAYQGWRVANVPIVLGVEPPEELFKLPRKRVVALWVDVERLSALRRFRADQLRVRPGGYADTSYVEKEASFALEVFSRRRDWPMVDVTVKPIEETASEVLALLDLSPTERGHPESGA